MYSFALLYKRVLIFKILLISDISTLKTEVGLVQ